MEKHNGFTIIELLVVIVVIGILAGIGVMAYSGMRDAAQDAARRSDVATIKKGIKLAVIRENIRRLPGGDKSWITNKENNGGGADENGNCKGGLGTGELKNDINLTPRDGYCSMANMLVGKGYIPGEVIDSWKRRNKQDPQPRLVGGLKKGEEWAYGMLQARGGEQKPAVYIVYHVSKPTDEEKAAYEEMKTQWVEFETFNEWNAKSKISPYNAASHAYDTNFAENK